MINQAFDSSEFELFLHFKFQQILTWGNNDKDKREFIRQSALEGFPKQSQKYEWYAFNIKVNRNRFIKQQLDIENVPKLIIDAFSRNLISKDKSAYSQVGIYDDDSLEYVRVLYVEGELTNSEDSTEVWVYGKNDRK